MRAVLTLLITFLTVQTLASVLNVDVSTDFGPDIRSTSPVCLSIRKGLDRICVRDKTADANCGFRAKQPINDRSIVAWDASSCVYAAKSEHLSEVEVPRKFDTAGNEFAAQLPEGIAEKYGPRTVAQALVARKFDYYERKTMKLRDIALNARPLYNLVRPVMGIQGRILPKILQNGFLNQHQTGTSRACLCSDIRELTESRLVDITIGASYGKPVGQALNSVFPKYAYAAFETDSSLVVDGLIDQYGTTLVVFNKDVNKRTTITNGDSIEESDIEVRTLYSPAPPSFLKHVGKLHRYFEAQIWGPLDMKDVSFLLTGCFAKDEADSVIATLKSAGSNVPVYRCLKTMSGTRARLQRGESLYGTET